MTLTKNELGLDVHCDGLNNPSVFPDFPFVQNLMEKNGFLKWKQKYIHIPKTQQNRLLNDVQDVKYGDCIFVVPEPKQTKPLVPLFDTIFNNNFIL